MSTNNRINTRKYIEEHLTITDKNGKAIPFRLNRAQEKLYNVFTVLHKARKPIRIIVLKARQMGFSTLVQAILFKLASTSYNKDCAIVAHSEQATAKIFKKSKYFFDTLTLCLRPQIKASNAQEIRYAKLNSSIRCYTAGGADIGRGSTLHALHISELAFWPNGKADIMLGIVQAVPNTPDSVIVIESTANGYDYFKELWDKAVSGESDYFPLFVGWHELDEYRMPYTGFEFTAEEKRLQTLYELDNEQISWRRWCIANNCGGDEEKFKQEYPINPEEAFISSGQCIFDQASIIRRLEVLQSTAKIKVRQGEFTYSLIRDKYGEHIEDIEWTDKPNGAISIYLEPKRGYPYVIAGDTAGDGSDFFIGQVLDNTTGEQVAVLRQQYDEDMYAIQMYCLGKYYNDGMIGIEANFSTYPIKYLEKLGYSNQYMRESVDSITHKVNMKYGFKTTSLTRPLIISELVRIARENIELINDITTLKEMLTFVRNEAGRAEALQGKHDDTVMALAIAHHIRPQYSMTADIPTTKRRSWLDDDEDEDNPYNDYFDGGM